MSEGAIPPRPGNRPLPEILIVTAGEIGPLGPLLESIRWMRLRPRLEHSPAGALQALRSKAVPVMLHADASWAESFLVELRMDRDTAECPVLVLVTRGAEASAIRALRWGADEFAREDDPEAVADILRALWANAPLLRAAGASGWVRVHAAAGELRAPLARAVRRCGYASKVSGCAPAPEKPGEPPPRFYVVGPDLLGAADKPEAWLSETARRAPVLLLAPDSRLIDLQAMSASEPRVEVLPGDALPETLALSGNRLCTPVGRERRGERRATVSRVVSFHVDGGRRWTWGMSFDMCERGLWVRTLLPPSREARATLRLSDGEQGLPLQRPVRVAWVCRPEPATTWTTRPPGFGAEIVGGSEKNRERWARLCKRILPAPASVGSRVQL